MLKPTPPLQTRLATPSQNNLTTNKSNHQHHAAHAKVIHLRIMIIAIFTHFKIGGDDGDGGGRQLNQQHQ